MTILHPQGELSHATHTKYIERQTSAAQREFQRQVIDKTLRALDEH